VIQNRLEFHLHSTWQSYLQGLVIIFICTLICWLLHAHFAPANLIMVYLVGVVFIAIRFGRGPSLLASVLSVAAFDFFFVPPYLTFAVSDVEYILTFILMLIVAITISSLTVQIKQQAEAAHERERRTASLYAMSREFANSRGTENLIRVAVHHIGDVFDSQVIILLADKQGQLSIQSDLNNVPEADPHDQGVAQWVYDHGQAAGFSTDTLPGAQGFYLPMQTARGVAGVLGIYPAEPMRFHSSDQAHLLETFANQTALAIERANLAEETEQARIEIETERQRNTLLSSISHDLRTPLASITGAVSSLLENEENLDAINRRELAQLAYEEAGRLNQQIINLLDMTRLESGAVRLHKEWQSLEEVVGTTLNHLGSHLDDHAAQINLPDDLPLVPFDSLLIGQVLVNLLENAVKYSPAGTPIEISASLTDDSVTVEVSDHGPGLPAGEEKRIFDKFYRAKSGNAHGVGLGLTICRSIIDAHNGHIWAENRPGGGAAFRFTIPIDAAPPEVKSEDGYSL
jgi:two-component system, OmpR family, sensor histidine kinase KdpD